LYRLHQQSSLLSLVLLGLLALQAPLIRSQRIEIAAAQVPTTTDEGKVRLPVIVKGSTTPIDPTTPTNPTNPTTPTTPTTRDPYLWPFAQDSIWNMPIGANARYVPAGITSKGLQTDIDWLIVTRASDPTVPTYMPGEFWPNRCKGTTPQQQAQWNPQAGAPFHVPVDTMIPEPDKAWNPNSSSAFLKPDGKTLVSFNATARCTPGGPLYGVWFGEQDLYGNGIDGGHGGSGMSSIGGSIRPGELLNDEPIRHALKLNIGGDFMYYNASTPTPGYRWPARLADSYAPTGYKGRNPSLEMGALLAIPPNVTAEQLGLQTKVGRKLFAAMQNYGAYVVDDSGGSNLLCVEQTAYEEYRAATGRTIDDDTSLDGDMSKLMAAVHVVDNNSASSVGGGGTPRAPLAPAFGPVDTAAPSTPTALNATLVTPSRIELGWQPSTDNVRVTSYGIWVNGSFRGDAYAPRFTLNNLSPNTSYTIAIEAKDIGLNRSARTEIAVTTAPRDAQHYEERFDASPSGWQFSSAKVANGKLELANWGGSTRAIYDGLTFPTGGQSYQYNLALSPIGSASANRTLVYFNYGDDNNTYWVEIGGGSDGSIELRKKVGGVETVLASTKRAWAWSALTISYASNGQISVAGRSNGTNTPLLTATDTALKAGKIGVGSRLNTVYVDDIWVEVK
jgi:hypothetical protein